MVDRERPKARQREREREMSARLGHYLCGVCEPELVGKKCPFDEGNIDLNGEGEKMCWHYVRVQHEAGNCLNCKNLSEGPNAECSACMLEPSTPFTRFKQMRYRDRVFEDEARRLRNKMLAGANFNVRQNCRGR